MFELAHGTGTCTNSNQELISRKVCARIKAPSAYIASKRSRIRHTISTINSSLPYFATEPKASAGGAVVQSKLSANAERTNNTAKGVYRARKRLVRVESFSPKSNVVRAHSSSKNLARLMITIDNPTEAAARQIKSSLTFIVFFSKIVAVLACWGTTLSMIRSCRCRGKNKVRSAMLSIG